MDLRESDALDPRLEECPLMVKVSPMVFLFGGICAKWGPEKLSRHKTRSPNVCDFRCFKFLNRRARSQHFPCAWKDFQENHRLECLVSTELRESSFTEFYPSHSHTLWLLRGLRFDYWRRVVERNQPRVVGFLKKAQFFLNCFWRLVLADSALLQPANLLRPARYCLVHFAPLSFQ